MFLRKVRQRESSQATYPNWQEAPEKKLCECESSRRRFLKHLAVGGSALGLMGLPKLSHGQTFEVDYRHLEGHPTVAPTPVPVEPELMNSAAPSAAAVSQGVSVGELGQGGQDLMATAMVVTENRALWVEPGYLLLVRWTRPDGNDMAISAFEGATESVRQFIASRVTQTEDLHNLDRLHLIEQGLVELLAPVVVPATIEALHLDHDCATVCSMLTPIGMPPTEIPLGGAVVAPGWE